MRYAVWSGREDFRDAVANQAHCLLDELDILPNATFSLGVVAVASPEGRIITTPECDGGSRVMAGIRTLVEEWSHRQNGTEQDEALADYYLGENLSCLLRESAKGAKSYVDWTWLNGDCVIMLLRLSDFDPGRVLQLSEIPQAELPASLVDAAMSEFIADALNGLKASLSQNLVRYGRFLQTGEVIRRAGQRLMSWLPYASNRTFDRGATLFDAISAIAALRYESQEAVGSFLFCGSNHACVKEFVSFTTPVPLADFKRSRNLLETVNRGADDEKDTLHLTTDAHSIRGIGKLVKDYQGVGSSLFEVRIIGHSQWELRHGSDTLMHVSSGRPRLPEEPFGYATFAQRVDEVFHAMDERRKKLLWDLTCAAREQNHGTIVVISTRASEEAERLRRQATRIEGVDLDRQLMLSLSSVDGAVLADTNGRCYAFGVILDGETKSGETPARGARFNSAVRYVGTQTKTHGPCCCAVVVSEDGTVDFLPLPAEDGAAEE